MPVTGIDAFTVVGVPAFVAAGIWGVAFIVHHLDKIDGFLLGRHRRRLERADAEQKRDLVLPPSGMARIGQWIFQRGQHDAGHHEPALGVLASRSDEVSDRLTRLEGALERVHVTVALVSLADGAGVLLEVHNKHASKIAEGLTVRVVGRDGQKFGPRTINREDPVDVEPGGRRFLGWDLPTEGVDRWGLALSWREHGQLVHHEQPVWNPRTVRP